MKSIFTKYGQLFKSNKPLPLTKPPRQTKLKTPLLFCCLLIGSLFLTSFKEKQVLTESPKTSFFSQLFTEIQEDIFSLIAEFRGTENTSEETCYEHSLEEDLNTDNTDSNTCGPATPGPDVTSDCTNNIAGKIYEDGNYDGVDNDGGDGIPGIKVLAYDCNHTAVDSTITDADGEYNLINTTTAVDYRIEFILPDSVTCYKKPTVSGSNNNSTVRAAQAGTCVNLGMATPTDYCQTNPLMALPCFVSGDPLAGGTSGSGDVLVSFNYENSGIGTNDLAGFGVAQNAPSPTVNAIGKEIGSTWGIAYQRSTQNLFTSAFIKRHVGLGPLGEGGIYRIDYSNTTHALDQWLDVTTIGMNIGTVGIGATFADRRSNRDLNAASNMPSNSPDTDAFFKVGRAGLGDIDISEDESTLWVMNLFDQTLNAIIIDADEDISTPPTNADLSTYPIPNPCGTGNQRPFALKVYQGQTYVGLVCENTLEAFIYSFDGTTFIPVIINGSSSIPLNYTRGMVSATGDCFTASGAATGNNGWFTWSGTTPPPACSVQSPTNFLYAHPEPLLSDIEFDVDGSIILGIIDRSGHMYGAENTNINTTDGGFESVHAGGDILRVCNIAGQLFMQGSTGGCSNNDNNNSGPNGGEFYYQDYLSCAFFCPNPNGEDGLHTETVSGGMALLPNSGEIAVASYDPFGTVEVSGGVNWFNNTTGTARNQGYLLYFGQNNDFVTTGGNFGKANGLGDVELLCEQAPIEIGNLVWTDENKNGIQEACEAGIDGLNINLIKDGATIATTQTANGGYYYFSNSASTDPNLTWTGTDTNTEVIANMTYTIQIADAIGSNGLIGLGLTTSNTGSNDNIDNDASLIGEHAEITFQTGGPGCMIHDADFGFTPKCSISLSYTQSTCIETNSGVFQSTLDVSIVYQNAPYPAQDIILDLDGISQSITTVASASNTAMIQLTVAADGTNHQLFAHFATDTECADTLTFKAPVPCVADIALDCNNVISGTAFQDVNFDGADNDNLGGIAGVKVLAYDCDNMLIDSTWTDADGEYQLANTTTGVEYRIEFIIITDASCPYVPSVEGANNSSSIQFAQIGTCIDFGVVNKNTACTPYTPDNTPLGTPFPSGKLLDGGIAFISCGTIEDLPPNERFTVGLVDIRNIGFANNRPEVNPTSHHHPSWLVDSIGNIFGIDTDAEGNMYAAASSHYAAAFGYNLGSNTFHNAKSVLRYGDIGGGADDLGAAGTVYQLDAITGQAKVFVQLPQQRIAYTSSQCEGPNETTDLNTGPGLGNITYDKHHDQFFVANFEDGKIYRVDKNGNIISFFDPQTLTGFTIDDGTAGWANDAKPYGLVVNPDGTQLFFGTHELDPTPNVYAVNLDATGDFSGTEIFHTELMGEGDLGFTFAANPSWIAISDLEFLPDGNLMVGMRTGCAGQYGTSHNHGATFYIMEAAQGDGLFNDLVINPDIQYPNDMTNNDDGYGGMDVWDRFDNTWDYVVTSSDTRVEEGPHGLIAFPHNFANSGNGSSTFTLQPSAAIPYFPSLAGNDFKGVGGDVSIFSSCGILPIAIGNYIWEDNNANGLQDACEKGIPNTIVQLYDANCTLIGVDITNANGHYSFNNSNVDTTGLNPDGTPITSYTGLRPNTVYYLVLGEDGAWSNEEISLNGENYSLTLTDAGNKDNIDSDATIGTGCGFTEAPFIEVTTGDNGDVDYSLDIGLLASCKLALAYTQSDCSEISPGVFEATFDVSIIYNNAPDPAEDIIVNFEGISQNITTIANGQDTAMVQITVTADGSAVNQIVAYFETDTECTDTLYFKAPLPCIADLGIPSGMICANSGLNSDQIGGTVFEDWNYDGLMNQSDTLGVKGVKVYLYDCQNNLIDSTYTDPQGNYVFDNLSETDYRIEFDLPATISCWAKPTTGGPDNNNIVQFVQPSNCANFGIAAPLDYCSDNPQLAVACYISGNGSTAEDALVTFDNQANNTNIAANSVEIGSVWGLAFDRDNDRIFSSAFLKRHIGLAAGGLDAIYTITFDPSNGNNGTYETPFNLSSLGIDVGTNPRTVALPSDPTIPSHDAEVYEHVGKIGIGDIDMDEANKLLYVMNLYKKELVALDVSDIQNIVLHATYPIPDPGCSDGDYQPFAIEINNGEVYIGTTCTAETSQDRSDIQLFVHQLKNGAFTEVYNMPLDYDRSYSYAVINKPGKSDSFVGTNEFQPWQSTWSKKKVHQAILSDLEIDVDGSLILSIANIESHREQPGNYSTDVNDTEVYGGATYAEGDILRICSIDGQFVREGEGACEQNFDSPMNNSIGDGIPDEFYYDDYETSADPNIFTGHPETNLGSVAFFPGSGEIATTQFDPQAFNSGGVRWNSNKNGAAVRNITLYDKETPGGALKGSGLGDIEYLCPLAPVEIGNYVWSDNNKNGIQEACEKGIANVILHLYNTACKKVAVDTTNADGFYYFNNASVVAFSGHTDQTLLTDTTYFIVVSGSTDTVFDKQDILLYANQNNYILTLDNQGTNDLIDSDGIIEDGTHSCTANFMGLPFQEVTTGAAGCTNHDYDFGFIPKLAIGNLVWEDLNNDGLKDSNEPGIDSVEMILYSVGADGVKGGNDDLAIDTTLTDVNGNYLFPKLENGIYYVKINDGVPTRMVSSTGSGADGTNPTTYEPSSITDDTNDDDNGTQMGMMIMSDTIHLVENMEPINDEDTTAYTNLSIDFGLIRLLSIGNLVWEDENNDGLNNNNEPGIDGITVYLLDDGTDNIKGNADDNLLDSILTATGGQYLFDSLYPGEYYVKLNSGIPLGMISSTAKANNNLNTEPATDPDIDDLNEDDNGTQMGTMVMSELVSLTLSDEPTDDGDVDSTSNLAVDFGLFVPLSIGNLVWEDLNNNGQVDVGEPGVEDVEIILFAVGPDSAKDGGDDIVIDTLLTNSNGDYLFDTLTAGTYYVKINSGIPAGMTSSTGTGIDGTGTADYEPGAMTDGNADNEDDGSQMGSMIMSDTIQLVKNTEPIDDEDTDPNTNTSVDFGLIRYLSIGNLVWEDVDNDGIADADENGINGVEVILYQVGVDGNKGGGDDVSIDTVITTGGGVYLFDSLYAGEYYVKLNAGLESNIISSTGEGTPIITGAGAYEPAADPDATDTNNDDDGTQMGTMIMSELVSLTLSDEPINDGDVDSTSNLAVDFGIVSTLSVGNLVWEDLDNDGQAEPNEPGVEDVEVIIYELGADSKKGTADDVEIKRDTTDANGNYLFDKLTEGLYFVKINEGIPSGMTSSTGTGADGSQASTYEPFTGTDANANNDDDGTQMGTMVMSDTFQLVANTEPINDEDTDDDTNLAIDFGLIRYLTLGNLVWKDTNNDGLNNDETGINGIEVQLRTAGPNSIKGDADDVLLETMLTTNGGQYLFDSLAPGDYYVKLNSGIPTGMISSTGEGEVALTGTGSAEPAADPDATDTNNDDDGTQMGTMVMSDLVSLTLSEEPVNDEDADSTSNLAVDFGLYQTLSIGNLVWEDEDNDGILDTDEEGIENVALILYTLGPDGTKSGGDDVVFATDTTDSNGNYNFENLPEGTYYVKINSGLPTGFVSSTGAGIDGSGATTFEPGSMTNNDVDNNDDGTQMGTMIMSDTILLVKNMEPTDDEDDNKNTNTTVDFGVTPSLSIGNLVWEDLDNDGVAEADETGIDGVEVILFKDGGDGIKGNADDVAIDTVMTANGGAYLFEGLAPAEYFVKLNSGIHTGFRSSTGEGTTVADGTGTFEPAADPDNNLNNDDDGTQMVMQDGSIMIMSHLVTLVLYDEPTNDDDSNTNTNLNIDFGLFETLELGDLVWEDLDNDGIAEAEEPGMENIEVVLFKDGSDGIKGSPDDIEIGKDTTDASGTYLFADLLPGEYFVKLNDGIPPNFVSSTGEGASFATGTGAYETAPDPDATNTNGDDDGTLMVMADGNKMIMSDLISMELYKEPINDGDIDSTTNYAVDFGLFELLSLGNLVWEDLDNDGEADANEPRIENIELILFKDGGDGIKGSPDDIEIGKETTDTNGNYLFDNLFPGEYFVKINELPFGMISSTGEGISSTSTNGPFEPAPDADGDTDNRDDGSYMDGMVMSTLISMELYTEPTNDGDVKNTTNFDIDFGLFQTLTLGNLVWEDLNNNGIVDPNEPGIENVEVILYRDYDGIKGGTDDVEIGRITTDTNGNYMFINLDAGMYYIKLNNGIPDGYMSSTGEGIANITGTGPYEPAPDPDVYVDMDDNGNQMTMANGNIMVMSDLISLVLYNEQTDSVINMDVDFGLYNTLEAGNLVWEDYNNNGMADAGEPGVEGVEVIIFQTTDAIKGNGDDIEVDRDTTDAMGMYLFQTLEAGDYWVKLNSGIPTGFYSSTGEGITTVTGTGLFEPSSMADDNIDDNDDGTQMGLGDTIMIMSDIVSLNLYDELDNDGASDSTANYRIDFGLIETIDLGNLVWEDYDNNGMKDLNEPGFPDVEVVLYQLGPDGQKGTTDDVEVAKDTTDNNGAYLFEYLYPNEYFVKLNDIPTGFYSSSGEGFMDADGTGLNEPAADADTNIDGDDDGTQMTMPDGSIMVMSDPISLGLYDEPTTDEDVDSTTNFSIDFGLYKSLELGNLVWEDLNNNGLVDPNEQGIKDIQVVLFKAGPDGQKGTKDDIEIAIDTTDTNGSYLFENLYPGEYFVKLNSGIPDQYTSSTGEGISNNIGIGNYEPAADPDDSDANNQDDGTQMGTMVMSDLISMELYTEPTDDGDLDSTTNYAIDFGLFKKLSIGNLVWEDYNNNGAVDIGEPGIEGVEVILYQLGPDGLKNTADDVLIADTLTDATGHYLFDELHANNYYIKLNNGIPTNMLSTTGEGINTISGTGITEPALDADNDIDHTDDGTQMGAMIMSEVIDLVLYDEPTNDADNLNNTNTAVDFGLFKLLSLGDLVWEDIDNDGILDPTEIGIDGIEVALLNDGIDDIKGNSDDELLLTTITANGGLYLFDSLYPGDYYVQLNNDIPEGAISSTGEGLVIISGAGPTEPATDPDDDTNSNDDGSQVAEKIASKLVNLALYKEPSNDGDTDSTTNKSIDFGLYKMVTIGDYVWEDMNGNGIQEEGEPPIENVLVELVGVNIYGDSISATTFTDAEGAYVFDSLPPANFGIIFHTPNGFTPTAVNEGATTFDSDANPDNMEIDPLHNYIGGTIDSTIDAGYYLPVTIGNFVWEDFNFNGIQDEAGAGIPNIPVCLCGTDGAGNSIKDTVLTDITGMYTFENLPPGAYQVGVKKPNEYAISAANQLSNDALDSDVNIEGITDFTVLESGDNNTSMDIGLYQLFDLALMVELAPGQAQTVLPGTIIEYQMTLFNQGKIDAYDIELLDYIPEGLEFLTSKNTTATTGNPLDWNLVNNVPSYTVPRLVAGEQTSVIIRFTTDPSFRGSSILNTGEISHAAIVPNGPNFADIDSQADQNMENDRGADPANDNNIYDDGTIDEDDHDPEIIYFISSDGIVVIGDTTIIKAQDATEIDATPPFTEEDVREVIEKVDCDLPTYCYHGLAIELMPVGMVQIWASDISVNNFTPCPGTRLRVWHKDLPMKQPTQLAEILALPTQLIFTCEHIGNQDVQLYIIDEDDNWNFCSTYINVQDNNGGCIDAQATNLTMALVAGQIKSWKGEAVEDVLLSTTTEDYLTSTNGFYHLSLVKDQAYQVIPKKDVDPLNGVSTFDLVLMTKHILGLQPFENPYQWIAADINDSKTITAFDLVMLRKMILAIDKDFVKNDSWRFVEATYNFVGDAPLSQKFPEMAQIDHLSQDMVMDFVAVKIGDVNGSAKANSLQSSTARTSPTIFELHVEDIALKAGQSYDILVSTQQIKQVQGYQFTMDFDGLAIDQLSASLMQSENFGLHALDQGWFTASWNKHSIDDTALTEKSKTTTPLFTIHIKALQDSRLSEVLNINHRPTIAEAYDLNGQEMAVQLHFQELRLGSDFDLFQNQPNPFYKQTKIGYSLPGNSEVTLILRNEAGSVLHTIKQNGKTGYNEIELDNLSLAPGFIYYQLNTKFGSKSKKMIRVE